MLKDIGLTSMLERHRDKLKSIHRQLYISELYDRICRTLTNYETGEPLSVEDMYETLCYIQIHWDEITGGE